MRSWGGVIGISGTLPFIDGASLMKPEFGSYSSEESKWIIEGHGVDPDIVVDNDPSKEYWGEDSQLNKAIEVIMGDLKITKACLRFQRHQIEVILIAEAVNKIMNEACSL